MKNRDVRPIFRFISEMIQDRAIVTMEYNETVPKLSNGTVFNDLATICNPDFKISPLFEAEYLRNDTVQRHYNGTLIGRHLRRTQDVVSDDLE